MIGDACGGIGGGGTGEGFGGSPGTGSSGKGRGSGGRGGFSGGTGCGFGVVLGGTSTLRFSVMKGIIITPFVWNYFIHFLCQKTAKN